MWHVLFWPFYCLSFDLQLQITHLVSSNSSINVSFFILAIVLSVLLWFTASDYPFGIFKLFYQCGMFYFGHCIVCPLIYSFRLPIWYLQTLLSMWHVLFCPLCFLSFFDLQLQITHLVSLNSSINVAFFILAIVLSVLLWFTASDYQFGIFKLFYQCGIFYFGHCVACPSLIYSFRLLLWYLKTLLLMWHFC
jgi:hypothetical protein